MDNVEIAVDLLDVVHACTRCATHDKGNVKGRKNAIHNSWQVILSS